MDTFGLVVMIILLLLIAFCTCMLIISFKVRKNFKKPAVKPSVSQNTRAAQISNTMATRTLQLIKESYNLMCTTDNPETFFARSTFVHNKIQELKQFENRGLYNNPNFSSAYYEEFMKKNFSNALHNCYARYVNKAKRELSTQAGIDKRINTFWGIVQKYLGASDTMQIRASFTKVAPLQKVSSVTVAPQSTQTQATQSIIESTSFDKAQNLEEIDKLARERSDRLYQERQSRIAEFNPYDIIVTGQDVELSSVEKSFLQYMNGNDVSNPYVPAYWVYEYNLEFNPTMRKLFEGGYLCVSNAEVNNLKVDELKELLAAHGCAKSGKKSDLITRALTEIPPDMLQKHLENYPKVYSLTDKGKDTVKNLQKSATKDLDFEDACLECIYSYRIKDAYTLVCQHEVNKMIPRGIMNWDRELINGLDPFINELYENFYNSDISSLIPDFLIQYEIQLKACIILGLMLGIAADKTVVLFIRVSQEDLSGTKKAETLSTIQEFSFNLMDAIQQHSFDLLR